MSRSLAALLASLALVACSGGSAAPGTSPGASLENLGLVARGAEIAGEGDLFLVAAREFQGGGRDLDADGDTFDAVVFVLDLATRSEENTFLALDLSAPTLLASVRGPLAVFAVSEASSGGRDLDADGDAHDAVAFVFDRRDGTTRGLGLALSLAPGVEPAIGGNLVAFAASEAAQGADLDGDGSRGDDVLHVYDSSTRALVNTGLDTPSRLFVDGGSVAWFADESSGDRNGDGDGADANVLQVYSLSARRNFDTGLATDGSAPQFAGGVWLVAVPELSAGRDLDGDGRLDSRVLHTFDPVAGSVRNLALGSADFPCALAIRVSGVREGFAFRVPESDGIDRNGDGDVFDAVLFLFAPRQDLLASTGIAATDLPVLAGTALGFLSLEREQGADLDLDGFLDHAVAFRVDLVNGIARNLRQEALAVRAGGELLLLARRESAEGADWNLDGDLDDVVVHAHSPVTRSTVNTRIASVDAFGASAQHILLYVDERAEGADQNLDGDLDDQVFVLFDLVRRRAVLTGLAGELGVGRFGSLSASGGLALLASELAQGRDLNTDGDLADSVLYSGK